MSIDLDLIRHQIAESIPWRDGVLTVLQAEGLVAEVDRLRGEVERERAAVVAWLRAEASRTGASPDERTILRWAASRIENGEHRREEEK